MIHTAAVESVARQVDPVTRRFIDAGFRLHLVGGVVRDLALASDAEPAGPVSPDIDLTTDAGPADIRRLVAPVAEAVWAQGERFGTIGARVDGVALEITTHRAERYDPESRKPVVTFGQDLHEDLSRRDFTVNAMAIELPTLTLHDPYHGRDDLAARVLRTPLSPDISFTDDPLRILRAARFAARFDLIPSPDLMGAASDLANRLDIVSIERITDELERLLATADPTAGLRFLIDVGALSVIIPALVGSGSLTEAARLAAIPVTTDGGPLVRRAGLLWPIRAQAGEELERLRYSRVDRATTARVIAGVETALGDVLDRPAVRRLVHRTGPDVIDAVTTLAAAVAAGDGELTGRAEAVTDEVAELRRDEGFDDPGPPLTGEEIMAVLGIDPGPDIGRAQQVLAEHRFEHGPIDAEQARAVLLQWWATRAG